MRLLLSRDVAGGWQVTGEHEAFTCRFSYFFLFKSKRKKKGLLPDDVVIERGRNRWENCGRSAMNRWRATHIKEQMLSSAGGWRKRQQPVTARHQFLTFPLAERASARSGPATRESGRGHRHWTTKNLVGNNGQSECHQLLSIRTRVLMTSILFVVFFFANPFTCDNWRTRLDDLNDLLKINHLRANDLIVQSVNI